MYTFYRFKAQPPEVQMEELNLHGVSLDLANYTKETEAVLFAYHNFYVELVVQKYTDDIISINCFRNPQKLEPYLGQVDITEISSLLFSRE